MQSTVDQILERSKESLRNIMDYITGGGKQKAFITDLDDIDLENDSYLDSAIDSNSNGSTNLEIYEFQQAYALKRDLYYAYADRSFLMKKSYDKRLGDHFRYGRYQKSCETTQSRKG
tara:strand:+ start:210 stop:560 length:351 start_codon:yes stop_codon:yes gene_type:complete